MGLLALLSVTALVIGAFVHRSSNLPSGYTWLEPLRTLRLVYEVEHFPTAILATYLLGEVRRRDPMYRGLWRRLGELFPLQQQQTKVRGALVLASALGFVDGVLFGQHDAVDIVSVFVLGFIAASRPRDAHAVKTLVGHVVVGTVGFACICYWYTIVKSLTFVARVQKDAALAGFEHDVFGFYPHQVIAAWASTKPAFVQFCDWVYFRFFHHMALTTVLLVGMRRQKERTEYLAALALCYLIGAPLYHLLPAAGPGYHDPGAYPYLEDPSLTTSEVRAGLFHNTMGVVAGKADVVRTWAYIACMPSLHVAHELVMLYYSRRSKAGFALSGLFAAATVVGVVVLGWHYVIDSAGGALVALVAIAIARWQRNSLMPACIAPADDAPLASSSLRSWLRDVVGRSPSAAGAAGTALPPSSSTGTVAGVDMVSAETRRDTGRSLLGGLRQIRFRGLMAITLAGLAVRLVVGLRDLATVDRLFVPDQAYYTLSIARSLAQGLGPTADGVTLTNGFQPLLAFLTVPVFWLVRGTTAPFVAALVIGAIADAATIWLLGRIAGRLGGPVAQIVAAALWALSPLAIANSMNGLETSLAVALQLTLVHRLAGTEPRHVGHHALTGAVAGLVLLARIDGVFLVAAIAVVAVVRLKNTRSALLAMFGTAAAVVAPWWIYSLTRFGTVIPESGAAIRAGLAVHETLYLTASKKAAWLAGSVFGPPVVDLPALRSFLFERPTLGVLVCAGLVITAGLAAWRLLARAPTREGAVLAFAVHALALVVFYACWLPALWFLRRYLCPVHAFATVLLAVGVARVFGDHARAGWVRSGACVALALAGGLAVVGAGRALRGWPLGAELDGGLEGAKAYAPVARDVMDLLPDGAVVGAFQSGALSYFAKDGVRVVNLDGVVDGEARRAGAEGRLLDYAFERGVTHIADWKLNLENLQRLSPEAQHGIQAQGVGRARPQGFDRFVVYAVEWDAPSPSR